MKMSLAAVNSLSLKWHSWGIGIVAQLVEDLINTDKILGWTLLKTECGKGCSEIQSFGHGMITGHMNNSSYGYLRNICVRLGLSTLHNVEQGIHDCPPLPEELLVVNVFEGSRGFLFFSGIATGMLQVL